MFVALVQEELVVNPEANHYLSFLFVENSVAFYHIVIENSLKHFAICEFDVSLSMLGVVFELSLIVGPSVAQLREVLIVELFTRVDWF